MAPTSTLLQGRPHCVPSLAGHSAIRCSQSDRVRLAALLWEARVVLGRWGRCPRGVGAEPSPGTQRAPHLRLGPAGGGRAAPAAQFGSGLSRRPQTPVPQAPAGAGGGAWVSVSCKRRGDREIEEFPGTKPGAQRFAGCGWGRRRGTGGRPVSRVRGPLEVPAGAGENRSWKGPT